MATTAQTRKLYDGKVELLFKPQARNRYLVNKPNGSFNPPGVTTIINQVIGKDLKGWAVSEVLKALGGTLKYEKEQFVWYLNEPVTIDEQKLRWASKAYTRRSDQGKDLGTKVHEWIENYLSNPDETFGWDKEIEKGVLAFDAWYKQNRPEVLESERIVYYWPQDESDDIGFCGTYDNLFRFADRGIVLWDTKTTKSGIYPENYIQLGFYAWAEIKNNPDMRINDLAIGNFTIDGKTNVVFASDLGLSVIDCIAMAKATYYLYRQLEPLKKLIKEFK